MVDGRPSDTANGGCPRRAPGNTIWRPTGGPSTLPAESRSPGTMHIDLYVAIAGLIVGFVVGLTGMGGGALMTPILVLLFKVEPLTAVSSDLVAALVMKPVGGAVHMRRGTVNLRLVRWLMIGSVP